MTIAIAHRGDPINHPENTLEAFTSAQALGADMVELDCKLTKDGHVVALHDRTLERLWGVPQAVGELTWAEIARVRRGPYHVPSLREILGEVDLPLMVDVPGKSAAEAVLTILRGAKVLDRCIFAGHTGALVHLRRLCPSAHIALSWQRRRLPGSELFEALKPDWFNPHHRLAKAGVVARMHERGLAVSTWTVDNRFVMARALRHGVDAVISNRVGRLVPMIRSGPPAGLWPGAGLWP